MNRLRIQDELITKGMGGVLPELSDETIAGFKRVLDIGCGTGGWLAQTAKMYPHIPRLIGIDANSRAIDYALERALEEQVEERVEFQVMDALLVLEFPQDYFDLVNLRFGTSFMRTWNWPKLLKEMRRVTRPGGIVRLSEYERFSSNDQTTLRMLRYAGEAFFSAGHLFSEPGIGEDYVECTVGIAHDLERLLDQYGFKNIQARRSMQECPASTPEGEHFAEDMRLGFRGIVPFMRKWRGMPDDYETSFQAMVDAMHQPDYTVSWSLLTAWGTKTSQPYV
jgi:ubiquinone/menaquinone biosynthesis C-methylase UbiE